MPSRNTKNLSIIKKLEEERTKSELVSVKQHATKREEGKEKEEGEERKSVVMVLTIGIHGSTRNEQLDVRSKPNDVLNQ